MCDLVGVSRVVLDLLSQPSHVDGHSGLITKYPAPYRLEQLARRNATPGMRQEEREQVELPDGQRQFPAGQPGHPSGPIDDQVAVDQGLLDPFAVRLARSTACVRRTSSRGENGLVT